MSGLTRRKPLRRFTPLMAHAKSKGLRRSKTPAQYKHRLWAFFSEYIRRRDADENGMVVCVSCQAPMHWKESQAGHYIPKSRGLAVYFEERNVASQCARCNLYLHGNQPSYALSLINRYGIDILTTLDALSRTERKISEWEYLELIDLYKSKLAALPQLPDAPDAPDAPEKAA